MNRVRLFGVFLGQYDVQRVKYLRPFPVLTYTPQLPGSLPVVAISQHISKVRLLATGCQLWNHPQGVENSPGAG